MNYKGERYMRRTNGKTIAFFLAVLMAAGVFSGCSGDEPAQSGAEDVSGSQTAASENTSDSSSASAAVSADLSQMFTDRDYEIGYEESESASIRLSGNSAQCDSDAVQISGSTVTITEEGTYILSGTLEDGMVIVDAEDTDKIHLVLDGAAISNSTSAAVYVREADKVFLTTAADTENTLSNGGEYLAIDDNNIDAVIFSKADLTLNGAGDLTIQASAGHGVVSKDDLIITSGTYTIQAESHGLSGKDSVRIANGSFTIESGKDGIHAENADDTEGATGFLCILDGTFQITSQGDGLSAGSYLQTEGGNYTLSCGGGSGSASIQKSEFGSDTSEESASTKGVKAGGDLVLNGGNFAIDSADDALHSNGSVAVNGGEFQLSTGDDGIHGDGNVAISAGSVCILESYEGIEGLTIDIAGGDIELTASDDGLNAAGGNDESGFEGFGGGFRGADSFAADSGAYVCISGGKLYIDASGDGIDSNGSLTVTGGETYVSGPDTGGNGALDYASEASITGGTFVAAGVSQMAQNFGSSSTQGTMLVTVSSQQAGSTISLSDSSGQEILSWQADKAFDSVLISCPEITEGSTYTLTAGSSETEVTMSSLVYGSSGEMGGMGGGPGGGMGGRPEGGMGGGQPPEDRI